MVVHQVHAVLVDPGAPRLITARDVVRAGLAGATSASEVSVPEPTSVAPDETLLTAAERMVQAGEGHVVVRDDGHGRARGVLSSFDVVAVLAGHEPRIARIVRPAPARPALSPRPLAARAVRDVMHRGIITCPPTASFADVASVLVERRIHTATGVARRRHGVRQRHGPRRRCAAGLRRFRPPGELAGTGIAARHRAHHPGASPRRSSRRPPSATSWSSMPTASRWSRLDAGRGPSDGRGLIIAAPRGRYASAGSRQVHVVTRGPMPPRRPRRAWRGSPRAARGRRR